ncbi:hypothetical protein PVW46_06710 [Mameliella sp. AT18]|uniref:hypothetical protein n=1 Tax=Mameliella sp. AT18 TaxID=3028385 RepID=UPI0008410D29|nr:hypothetical protein [Mameliella sp. AT18]MDD9729596.1 hypothetical protein [Mameliella sp. AT18]ODM48749.1 hypothetical protein A9320_03465 [Ruegeria sp. PBVC088]
MNPRDAYDALIYLEACSMPQEWLGELHQKGYESYAAGKNYWFKQAEKGSSMWVKSERYGHRLCFVAEGLKKGRRDFESLVKEANLHWPK